MEKILRYSIPERHDEHDYLILGGFTIAKGTKDERDRILATMKKVLSNIALVKDLSRLKSSRRNILAEVELIKRMGSKIAERIRTDRYATICKCCPKPESLTARFRLHPQLT